MQEAIAALFSPGLEVKAARGASRWQGTTTFSEYGLVTLFGTWKKNGPGGHIRYPVAVLVDSLLLAAWAYRFSSRFLFTRLSKCVRSLCIRYICFLFTLSWHHIIYTSSKTFSRWCLTVMQTTIFTPFNCRGHQPDRCNKHGTEKQYISVLYHPEERRREKIRFPATPLKPKSELHV